MSETHLNDYCGCFHGLDHSGGRVEKKSKSTVGRMLLFMLRHIAAHRGGQQRDGFTLLPEWMETVTSKAREYAKASSSVRHGGSDPARSNFDPDFLGQERIQRNPPR